MRGASIGALVIVAALAAPARAQLCHDLPALDEHADHATMMPHVHAAAHRVFELAVHTELAGGAREQRDFAYQGTALLAAAHLDRLHLSARLPAYALRDHDDRSTGLGDASAAAWLTILRGEAIEAGLGSSVSAPTGDELSGLGMGHWMLMPGVFVGAHRGALAAQAIATYDVAVAAGGHVHGAGPVVAPMSLRELGLAARVGEQVAPALRVFGQASIAIPFDDAARAAVGGGVVQRVGDVELRVLIETGALARPFTSRGSLELAYRFR